MDHHTRPHGPVGAPDRPLRRRAAARAPAVREPDRRVWEAVERSLELGAKDRLRSTCHGFRGRPQRPRRQPPRSRFVDRVRPRRVQRSASKSFIDGGGLPHAGLTRKGSPSSPRIEVVVELRWQVNLPPAPRIPVPPDDAQTTSRAIERSAAPSEATSQSEADRFCARIAAAMAGQTRCCTTWTAPVWRRSRSTTPTTRNALSPELSGGCSAALERAGEDDVAAAWCCAPRTRRRSPRARTWAASPARSTRPQALRLRRFVGVFELIGELGKPTLCAARGHVLAGALGIALACD